MSEFDKRDTTNADREPPGRTDVYRSSLGRRTVRKVLPLVLGVVLMAAFVLIDAFGFGMSPEYWNPNFPLLVVFSVALVWMVAGTTYRVRGGKLILTTMFRWHRIALDEIAEIRKVCVESKEIIDIRRQPRRVLGWNPRIWSDYGRGDYALGTDVIEIITPSSRFILSPRDEKGFLAALDACADVGG